MVYMTKKDLVVNSNKKEYEDMYFSLANMFGGLGPIVFTSLIDFVMSLLTQKAAAAIFALTEPESLILGAVLIVAFIAPATKVLDVIWDLIIRSRMRKNHVPNAEISAMLKEFAAECGSVDDQ